MIKKYIVFGLTELVLLIIVLIHEHEEEIQSLKHILAR